GRTGNRTPLRRRPAVPDTNQPSLRHHRSGRAASIERVFRESVFRRVLRTRSQPAEPGWSRGDVDAHRTGRADVHQGVSACVARRVDSGRQQRSDRRQSRSHLAADQPPIGPGSLSVGQRRHPSTDATVRARAGASVRAGARPGGARRHQHGSVSEGRVLPPGTVSAGAAAQTWSPSLAARSILAPSAMTVLIISGLLLLRLQAPAQTAAGAAPGAQLCAEASARCQGADAKGDSGPNLTTLWASGATDDRVAETIRRGVPGSVMPASRASDADIRAIVAYLKSLAPPAAGAADGTRAAAE